MASADAGLTTRMVVNGADSLSDAELLAVACAVPLGDALGWLAKERGAPSSTGARGQRLLESRWQALRVLGHRLDAPPATRPVLGGAEEAAALFRSSLARADVEELHVLGLDSRNRLLRRAVVARGSVNQVVVTAREVFRPLVAAGAARAIVAHNHPSGDPSPSAEDRELTMRLGIAGELLGITLLDHLVIAADGYFSFAEHGGRELRPESRRGARRKTKHEGG